MLDMGGAWKKNQVLILDLEFLDKPINHPKVQKLFLQIIVVCNVSHAYLIDDVWT